MATPLLGNTYKVRDGEFFCVISSQVVECKYLEGVK